MLRIDPRNLLSRLIPRTAAAILATVAIALPAGAGTAIALADGGNTSAVAINTKDGSSVFKLAFAIRQVTGSVVDNQNVAVAYSSCAACQTVAISIQVLLITGDPTTFAPVNAAIAINQNCTSCDTLAAAYQFAIGVGTRLKFTHEGRREIAEIRRQLERLRKSGLTGPQIAAQVGALMNELSNVLQTQLVGVREPAAGPDAGSPAPTAPSGTSPTPSAPAGASTPADTTPTTTSTTPTTTSTAPTTTTTPTSATTTPTTTTTTPTTTTP
jgi:putative peptide zinc metalloprotease protein